MEEDWICSPLGKVLASAHGALDLPQHGDIDLQS